MTNPSATDARALYLRTVIFVSGVLVFSTFLLRWGFPSLHFLAPFNLTNENILAAWWSGTLLLLGSLHAADGFFRLRRTNLRAALAWCVIAAMLLYLSADEMASLHERADDYLEMGRWMSFLPFLLVLVGGCAWAFTSLWKTPSERRSVPWLIAGFVILASVGFQEYLEKTINWPWYLKALRSTFEEGSELVGMILLIHTMLPNSPGLFESARPPQNPAFSSVWGMRWLIAILSAALVWPVATLTAWLEQNIGHPSDWLAAALFIFAAILVLHAWMRSTGSKRSVTMGIVWLCAASGLCLQINPVDGPVKVFDVLLNSRLLVLGLCCLGAAEFFRSSGRGAGAACFALIAVLGLASAVNWPESLWWTYFGSSVLGLASFIVTIYLVRQPAKSL